MLASIVVFLVALPLCIGIAVACGVSAERGIVTGIIGGIAVGAISGAPLLVSGPAASLIVPVYDLIEQHGIVALAPVVILAGAWQVLAGVLRLGQWFRAVAPAVVHGMLIGIGILILASQAHVAIDGDPASSFIANVLSFPAAVGKGIAGGATGIAPLMIGVGTLVILAGWTRFRPKRLALVPGHLVALVVATAVSVWLPITVRHLDVSPAFFDGLAPVGLGDLSMLLQPSLIGLSLVFAFVASAATLLTATAIDQRQNHSRADYDREMVAQGLGNMLTGAVGGLPMTGVVVRSSVNVDAGARTRLSTVLHGCWLAAFVVAAPQLLELIPRATLGAVLVYVGVKLVDVEALRDLYRRGWHELGICAVTLSGVVFVDLLSGILVGFAAALMKVVYTFTHLEIRSEGKPDAKIQHMHLIGSATFLRLPRLALALEAVPQDRALQLHIDRLDHIDHACLDLLSAWGKRRESESSPGMEVEWSELGDRYRTALMGGRPVTAAPIPLLEAVWADWQELYRRQGRDADGRALPDDWIDEARVHARYAAPDHADVVRRAAELLAPRARLRAAQLDDVFASQANAGVSLGHGVSLVHARIEELDEPVVAVVTTENAISSGEITADVFFVLLAPTDDPQRHLHALARVGRLCHDHNALARLREATDASTLVEAVALGSRGDDPPGLADDAAPSLAILEVEDEHSATRMAEVVTIAFRRPIQLTRRRGPTFELFRLVAQADPGHRLLIFPIGCDDAGVVQALLDQQAKLYPGALCKLRLLERR